MSTQPRSSRPRSRLPLPASPLEVGPSGTFVVRYVDEEWRSGRALVPARTGAEAATLFRLLHPTWRLVGAVEGQEPRLATCTRCGVAHRGWLGEGPSTLGHRFEAA